MLVLQLLASCRHIPPCLSPGQQLDLLQDSPAHPTAWCCHGLGNVGQDAQPSTCSCSNSCGSSPCSVPPPGSLCFCPPGPWGLLSSQPVPASCEHTARAAGVTVGGYLLHIHTHIHGKRGTSSLILSVNNRYFSWLTVLEELGWNKGCGGRQRLPRTEGAAGSRAGGGGGGGGCRRSVHCPS